MSAIFSYDCLFKFGLKIFCLHIIALQFSTLKYSMRFSELETLMNYIYIYFCYIFAYLSISLLRIFDKVCTLSKKLTTITINKEKYARKRG